MSKVPVMATFLRPLSLPDLRQHWRSRRARSTGSFLAIEWDEREVRVLEARIKPGEVRIVQARAGVWPSKVRPFDAPQRAGSWLREQLDEWGIKARRVLAALPRTAATLTRLELPAVPDDVLPGLVHFQAAARSSLTLEQLCLDFIPLPHRDDLAGREVLLVTVPRERVTACVGLLTTAGLEPIAIGLRPLAAAEAAVHGLSEQVDIHDEPALLVTHVGHCVEISIVWQRHLIYSSPVRLPQTEAGLDVCGLLAAIRRMLAALESPITGSQVRQAWLLAGPEDFSALELALKDQFDWTVRRVDPLAAVAGKEHAALPAAGFASVGPLGMLLAHSGSPVPAINLLAPREPPVRPNRQRVAMAVAGTLAVLVIGAGWLYRDARIRALDQQIEELAAKEAGLQRTVTEGEPALKSAELVKQWTAGNIPWLEELLNVTATVPEGDQIYLTTLQLAIDDTSGRGGLKASGYSRQQEDVMTLNQQLLAARDRYELLPHGIHPSQKDPEYPWRFELEAILGRPTPHPKQVKP